MAPKMVRSAAGVLIAWLAGTLALPRVVALDVEPRLLTGNYVEGGTAYDVAVSGNYAFVAVRESGLHIIDISEPARPRRISRYAAAGYALDVAVSGGYAYLVTGRRPSGPNTLAGGLEIIDVGNPANPRPVGRFETTGDPQSVAVSANYAYLAEHPRFYLTNWIGGGVYVLDITNPADPQLVGKAASSASGVAVAGNHAYLLSGGLQIFDISDPANPEFAGAYPTNGSFVDVVVSGNYAYLADGVTGLHIVDIGNPADPQPTGRYPSAAFDLAISGNRAFVATRPRTTATDNFPGGLHAVDISQPANPRLISRYDGIEFVSGVAASGNYAYPVSSSALAVIDFAVPSSPTLAGGYLVQHDARDVALAGQYAYVADGIGGLEIYDISNAAEPERVAGFFLGAVANSVAVAGNHALLVSTGALNVIDINDPAAPQRVARYTLGDNPRKVTVSGRFAYVASKSAASPAGGGGLHVIDINDPANPQRVGGYLNSHAVDVAIAGKYAYLTVEPQRSGSVIRVPGALEVIDISNPANPNVVGRYITAEHTQGIAVSGNYAYVADGRAGVHAIDISNPSKPERVATFSTTGYLNPSIIGGFVDSAFTFVTVVSNRCYATELFLHFSHGVWVLGSSVQVINSSDPAAPVRVGSARAGEYENEPYTFGSHAQGMVLSGNHLFVAGGKAGLQVMDLSTPAPSQVLAHYAQDAPGPGVASAGNYLYLGTQRRWTGSNFIGGGLEVIDISDPARPRLIGAHGGDGVSEVAVAGTNACALEGISLVVFDISDPTNPIPVGRYDPGAVFVKLALSGNYAYLAAKPHSGRGGLHVIDISNPSDPQPVGRYDSGAEAFDVAVSGNYAYMAQGPRWNTTTYIPGGLQVINITNPTNPQPVGAYTNSSSAHDVAVVGSRAYLVGPETGLQVLDVSDPANPQRLGGNDTLRPAETVTVSGDYAYLMDFEARLHVVDIRDPVRPQRVGINTSFTAFFGDVPSSIAVANGKVFACTAAHGLFILHPYRPIRFERIAHSNGVHLRISGPPGIPGRIQRGDDLRAWTDWLPITFGEAPIDVLDSGLDAIGFYRIAVP